MFKTISKLILICVLPFAAKAQYFLRGVVNDESGKGIYNVKIILKSRGATPFYTGAAGVFGIVTSVQNDSATLYADGYETLHVATDASRYLAYTLKLTAGSAIRRNKRLSSYVRYNENWYNQGFYSIGESYSNLIENDFIETSFTPETAFSLSINRASYSNIRRFINNGLPVPPDAVRIEEMLNYFTAVGDSAKNYDGSFTSTSKLTSAPWSKENKLLFLHLKSPALHTKQLAAANIVFLIDVSGSMDQQNRLPLLKDAFKMLINNLREQDTIAIVIYGGTVGTWLQPTSGKEKDSLRKAIDKLEAGGETPGEAAIKTAYTLAEKMYRKDANNRIILATDGDFNVGQSSEHELENLVVSHRQSGIFLTCLGVGSGNYKDSKLEALAKKGNGNFAYIDQINEAEKVLVTEFISTMYAVAKEAVVQIKFNTDFVKKYRLIGYDNKKDYLEDSTSELEGGEIGAGHHLTAVFEIEPTDLFASTNEDDIIATAILQYKKPSSGEMQQAVYSLPLHYISFDEADSNTRFLTSVIMLGGLLKQSDLWKTYTWNNLLGITKTSIISTNYLQKEFLELAEKAKEIYLPLKPRKKKKKN